MFGRNKKIIKLKKDIESLQSELEQKEEDISDLEDKIETQSVEIAFLKTQNERISKERDKLSGEISELRKRNVYLESLDRVQNINTALKEQEKRHIAEKNAKNDDIAKLEQQIRSLQAQLQLQAPNNSKTIPEDEQVRIRMNQERFNVEEQLEDEKAFSKRLSDRCSELRKEVEALKSEFKKPKNCKFKCTRTESFYVYANGKNRPSDISVVTYSIYAIDDKTNKLKELKQTEYFIERFYWPSRGYSSFEPPLQIFPDNISRPYKSTDNSTYMISFNPELKVELDETTVNHIYVIKHLISEALKKGRRLYSKTTNLFKRYDDHFEKLQIVSEEFDKLNEEFKTIQKEYSENIKRLEADAKEAKNRFNEKFEKYSKGQ